MKKIGILTFNSSYNYGALLQAYATQKFLENNSHNVLFINYLNEYEQKWNKIFSYRKNKSLKENIAILIKNVFFGCYWYNKESFKDFVNIMPKTQLMKKEDFKNFNDFDILLAGSDQIWNPNIYGGEMDTIFLFDFPTNSKKISFASSFGSYRLNEIEKKEFARCLKSFSCVTTREDFGIEQIKKMGISNVKKVCDPTMLLSSNDWEKVIDISDKKDIKEPYLVVYLMTKYEDYMEQIKSIADYYSLKIVFVTFSNIKRKYVDYYAKGYTPFEFLRLIKRSKLVLTNSFHGTVFSLLFKKEFYNLENVGNPERALSLLNEINLTDRIIKKDSNLNEILTSMKDINYEIVGESLEKISAESKKILLDAINE